MGIETDDEPSVLRRRRRGPKLNRRRRWGAVPLGTHLPGSPRSTPARNSLWEVTPTESRQPADWSSRPSGGQPAGEPNRGACAPGIGPNGSVGSGCPRGWGRSSRKAGSLATASTLPPGSAPGCSGGNARPRQNRRRPVNGSVETPTTSEVATAVLALEPVLCKKEARPLLDTSRPANTGAVTVRNSRR